MRVLALAGYDSFLNTVRLIAPYFEKQGASIDFALVSARKKKQISGEQVAEMGFGKPIPTVTIKNLCESGEINTYDIVLSCLEGMSTRRLFHYLDEIGSTRPLVICVYPGLVLRYAFDGFSMRASADLLWLNCQKDIEAYKDMCQAFGHDGSNARLFGNACLLEKIEREPNAHVGGPVVFFEQAVIPRYYYERRFLVEQLCALATRYPTKEFLIKARAAGRKATLHRTWHPIEHLFQEVAQSKNGVPSNIHFTEERAPILIAKASHCLTISSTVAIEAIHAGVPTTLISDFGAHDDYGLQYFYGSGILKNFENIDLATKDDVVFSWLTERTKDPSPVIESMILDAFVHAEKRNNRLYSLARSCENSEAFRKHASNLGEKFFLARGFKSKLSLKKQAALHLKRILQAASG